MAPKSITSLIIKQTLRFLFILVLSNALYFFIFIAFGLMFYAYQITKSVVRAEFNFTLARIYFEADAETSGWALFSEMIPIAIILGVISGFAVWISDIRNNGKLIDGALVEMVEWLIRK